MGFDLVSGDLNIVFSATTLQQTKLSCQKTKMQHFKGLILVVTALVLLIFLVISAFTYCTWVSKSHSSPVLPPSQPQAL
jgi:hypothetical protein